MSHLADDFTFGFWFRSSLAIGIGIRIRIFSSGNTGKSISPLHLLMQQLAKPKNTPYRRLWLFINAKSAQGGWIEIRHTSATTVADFLATAKKIRQVNQGCQFGTALKAPRRMVVGDSGN